MVEKLFITHDFIIYSDGLQLFFAILLLCLGISISVQGIRKLWETKADKAQPAV
ncbi:hypothetical protein [Methanolapillus millepedarum]|uniref:hypothetical protein n=1 Tax=Methanolapillus millepedarum TaxID=3028296 RepID=UPI0030B8A068